MYFVIDPIYSADEYLTFAQEIDAAYSGGPSVALATLIRPGEFSAMETGAKLFIRENGTTEGTLGDAALDADAIKNALDLMAMGRNKHVKTRDGAQYFIEAYTTPPQLVLCGGGHVSKSIAPLAKTLGFRLFITDDREEFANAERFPQADIIIPNKPEDAIPELPVKREHLHRHRHAGPQVRQRGARGRGCHERSLRRTSGQQAQDDPHL